MDRHAYRSTMNRYPTNQQENERLFGVEKVSHYLDEYKTGPLPKTMQKWKI